MRKDLMKWYTQPNGTLCLGTKNSLFAYFHIATDVTLQKSINAKLTTDHIKLIGSFPEEWSSDNNISSKINRAAIHFFGLACKPSLTLVK